MLFIIVNDSYPDIYINANRNGLVETLYEESNVYKLYFRGEYLRPDKQLRYYFPYMTKAYIYDRLETEEHIMERSTCNDLILCVMAIATYLICMSIIGYIL